MTNPLADFTCIGTFAAHFSQQQLISVSLVSLRVIHSETGMPCFFSFKRTLFRKSKPGWLFFFFFFFALISFPVRWAGPLRWDGRSHGVDVRGPACSPAASPGPPSEPRTAAARQPALRNPRSPSERYAHQHGLCCQRRFKEG